MGLRRVAGSASTVALLAGLLGRALACASRARRGGDEIELHVVSPRGTYLVFDEVSGAESITVAGPPTGAGRNVDINCYAGEEALPARRRSAERERRQLLLHRALRAIDKRRACCARSPTAITTDYPPGSPSPFQGPTLGIGRRGAIT